MESSFPHFRDGDVNIVVYKDVYRLHSSTLKACSRELRDLLSSLSPFGFGHYGYLQLELVESVSHGYGVLEVQDPNDQYQNGSMYMQLQKPIIMWPPAVRLVWANMFKIFYDLSPLLDQGGLENVLSRCWDLIDLADCLRATRAVFPMIETSLQDLGSHFYALIADDPINWMKLGTYMRSALIFKEAAIHIIGNWNALGDDLDYLPSVVHELCESRYRELVIFKQELEARMLQHCPYQTLRGGPHSEFMVAPYAKDLSMWMAMTFYSQWFCVAICENRTYFARDGGAAFYRSIYAGGDAYLGVEEQETYNVIHMNARRARILENRLGILKADMSRFVAVLLVNESRYDADLMGELPYLTCCKIEDDELPWITWPDGDWHVDSDEELFLSDYERIAESDMDDVVSGTGFTETGAADSENENDADIEDAEATNTEGSETEEEKEDETATLTVEEDEMAMIPA
ncbi:uncharacterized protein BDW43DRAFT_94725 [Aspergillus alliaceus]|uniref:uncharacterized protein n=1 Tax=Petromyces alliaceus TaxID=209559 RepID=UPI0012A53FDB|nr:uncharacterized protein BDW43DRAFT_94725 [Aspergillus alliaceus]KAB8233127.1 hypothetical protein BDW43DRAFT_94725 [Aspergillus alliaceus]